jgi:hypothetical protein
MSQVAKIENAPEPMIADAPAIVAMIERAARDPNVDIDKMERLLQMQERVLARNAEQAFNVAMTAAQSKMRAVATDSNNPQTRSRYASYAALDRAVRPIYTAEGFALSFDTADGAPDQYIRVVCHVSHRGGFSRTYHIDMPADGKGAKGGDVMTKTHAVGAGSSYGQRYLLKMIFNIAIGEDVDGNEPVNTAPITDEQAAKITALIGETQSNIAIFLKWVGAESVSDIPAHKFAAAIAGLEAKKRSKK